MYQFFKDILPMWTFLRNGHCDHRNYPRWAFHTTTIYQVGCSQMYYVGQICALLDPTPFQWQNIKSETQKVLELTLICDFRCDTISQHINIARGTTDPEIDFVTWIKLATTLPLAIVANLNTRGRHLPFASRFVLHFKVQMTGSILKADKMF